MSSTTIPAEISTFAAQVREALSDLPTEEVDDLTDGLDADLAEEYADTPGRALPPPADYALELRTAAGLPQPVAQRRGLRDRFTGLVDDGRLEWVEKVRAARANPAAASVLDFFAVLTPVWWVFRAYSTTWLMMLFFGAVQDGFAVYTPTDGLLLFFLAAVVVSVQWGRGRWTFRGQHALRIGVNLVAIVLLPFLIGGVLSAASTDNFDVYGNYDEGYEDALNEIAMTEDGDGAAWLGAVGIHNIYAYDARGRPLIDVQLFDQDGRPLSGGDTEDEWTCPDDDDVCGEAQPARLVTGASVMNVFPLRFTSVENESGALTDGSSLITAPFLMVPAVDSSTADRPNDADGDEAESTESPSEGQL